MCHLEECVPAVRRCLVGAWDQLYLQMEQRGPGPHSFTDLQVVLLPGETGRALVIGWQNFNVDCSNGWPEERGRVWAAGPHRNVHRERVNKHERHFIELKSLCSSQPVVCPGIQWGIQAHIRVRERSALLFGKLKRRRRPSTCVRQHSVLITYLYKDPDGGTMNLSQEDLSS